MLGFGVGLGFADAAGVAFSAVFVLVGWLAIGGDVLAVLFDAAAGLFVTAPAAGVDPEAEFTLPEAGVLAGPEAGKVVSSVG